MIDGITLENSRFNQHVKINPEGSIFLGYLYTELCIETDALGGDPVKIGMPDLQVRLTVDGHPRIEFPKDEKLIQDKNGNSKKRWVARYFSASKATRNALTTLVFALPAVSRAVELAERERENAA